MIEFPAPFDCAAAKEHEHLGLFPEIVPGPVARISCHND
jgi:hypothetical protein